MNKFLSKMHRFLGCCLNENKPAIDLKEKVVNGKQKDLSNLKKTNGVIKVMIESGELNLKVDKK